MKISWISIVGALLTIFYVYLCVAYKDTLGEFPVPIFLLLVSLVYLILGTRKNFQNSAVKISLLLFAILGGLSIISEVFKGFLGSSTSIIIIYFAFIAIGFCSLLVGIIWWIYDEIKGRDFF